MALKGKAFFVATASHIDKNKILFRKINFPHRFDFYLHLLSNTNFGDDALRGNTRSHPEHDG